MRTRSFIQERDGQRFFLEICWEGPEVEIASGRLGTKGRVREKVFASEASRDAFIESETQKILNKGYSEVGRLDTDPTAENGSLIPPEIGRFRRPAWIPRFHDNNGTPTASKLGGLPWLRAGDPWPTLDDKPMPLLLQLNLNQLTELGLGRGLLQVFYEAGDGSYDDWEPWTPTKQIRIVAGDARPSATSALIEAHWPEKLIVGFDRVDELPDVDTLRLYGMTVSTELDEHLSEYERPRAGFKIGGWPHWIHGARYPRCLKTRFPARYILQFDSNDQYVTFGDTGVAHVFQSPAFPELLTMTWQSC